jgi:flagellar protein FliO/FliZ
MASSSWFSSALWFAAIVGLIPLSLWLLRRSPAGARLSGAASGAVMRSVAVLPLSANQRIVTVEVGTGEARCWLVLGVTPGGITALHTMAPQADSPASPAPALPGFAQLLGRLRRDQDTPDGR